MYTVFPHGSADYIRVYVGRIDHVAHVTTPIKKKEDKQSEEVRLLLKHLDGFQSLS